MDKQTTTLPPHLFHLHEEACRLGLSTYTDPETGYLVFTRLHHLERGKCCTSGCRHCPWNFNPKPVPPSQRASMTATS